MHTRIFQTTTNTIIRRKTFVVITNIYIYIYIWIEFKKKKEKQGPCKRTRLGLSRPRSATFVHLAEHVISPVRIHAGRQDFRRRGMEHENHQRTGLVNGKRAHSTFVYPIIHQSIASTLQCTSHAQSVRALCQAADALGRHIIQGGHTLQPWGDVDAMPCDPMRTPCTLMRTSGRTGCFARDAEDLALFRERVRARASQYYLDHGYFRAD